MICFVKEKDKMKWKDLCGKRVGIDKSITSIIGEYGFSSLFSNLLMYPFNILMLKSMLLLGIELLTSFI